MKPFLILGLSLTLTVYATVFAADKPEAILKAKHHWIVIIDQMPKAHIIYDEKPKLAELLRDGYDDPDTKIHCHFSFEGNLRNHGEDIKTSCDMGSDYKMATYPLYCSDKQAINDTWYEVYYKGKVAFSIEVHCR